MIRSPKKGLQKRSTRSTRRRRAASEQKMQKSKAQKSTGVAVVVAVAAVSSEAGRSCVHSINSYATNSTPFRASYFIVFALTAGLYGCQVWATYSLTYDSSVITPTHVLHLGFLKMPGFVFCALLLLSPLTSLPSLNSCAATPPSSPTSPP